MVAQLLGSSTSTRSSLTRCVVKKKNDVEAELGVKILLKSRPESSGVKIQDMIKLKKETSSKIRREQTSLIASVIITLSWNYKTQIVRSPYLLRRGGGVEPHSIQFNSIRLRGLGDQEGLFGGPWDHLK